MKINKLRLKGFIGIKRGLGLDEINIDFSDLSGLIALSGENGAGKTSIIDNLHPYRTLPSRKRTLQHHTFLRDSCRDLEFDFNGDQYRSLIKIDSDNGRSEAYLWKNGKSMVDGKVSNYDHEIINLFGSPELFFNSVFCHQGSRKINEMTTGELKAMFSEFLRLDQLVDYENTSKQCAIILGNKLEAMETAIDRLTQTARGKADIATQLSAATTQLKTATQNIKELEKERDAKQDELRQAQAAVQKNVLLNIRAKELETEQEVLTKEIWAFEEKFKKDISDIGDQGHNAGIDIVMQDSLLANEKDIRDASRKVADLNRQIEEIKKLGQDARTRETMLRKEDEKEFTEWSSASSKLQKYQQETRDTENRIKSRIKTCEEKLTDLDKKDPECQSTTCSFIIGALEAEKELPGHEYTLSEWQTTRRTKEDEYKLDVESSQKSIDDIHSLIKINEKAINDLLKKHKQLDGEIKELQPMANDLPKVEIATQRKADLIKRREEIKEQEKKVRINASITKDELREKRLLIDGKLENTQKQIDKNAVEKAKNVRTRIDELTVSIKRYNEDEIPKLKADAEVYTRKIEEIEKAEDEWEKAKIQADIYSIEISEWTYLKNACSKDGLRALEIDSVAPVITGYANDLLLSTFGPTFSVRFRTQDEETGREVLDILVLTEDSEVLLDNLSGGQKIWILQSLRLAMTLISKEKSGKNFLTGFADELDGPLDISRAIEFTQMYKSFMSIGGFESFYFISHKPETISLADYTINLNGNGISIK